MHCPILQDTHQIQGLSHDLIKTLRKLRHDLITCKACPSFDSCQYLREFNAIVSTSLEEIAAEWNNPTTLIHNPER